VWSPEEHLNFPIGFQDAVKTMIMASRRPESLMYSLQDDIVFFIMNKCSWDWWGKGMRLPPHRIAAMKAAAEAEVELAARRARPASFGPGSYHSFAPPRGAHAHELYESLLGAVATHMYVGQGAAGSGLDDEVGSALDDEEDEDDEVDEDDEDEDEDEDDEDEDEDVREDEDDEDDEDEDGAEEEGAKAEPASLVAAAAALTSGVELE
jgi:hypothetical protein